MLRLVLLSMAAALLCACGPDVSLWKGTWTGSVIINTGRAPQTFQGTLVIADGAQFTATSTSGASTLTCALSTSTVDGARASFALGSRCSISAVPAGDCTTVARFDALELTRAGDALSATGRGQATTTCTSGGSTTEDFSLTGTAIRG